MPSSPEPALARPKATVLGAYLEGWRRVMAAPRLAAGVWALTWIVALPLALGVGRQIQAQLGASASASSLLGGWNAGWAAEFAAHAHGPATTLTDETLGFGGTLATLSRLAGGQPVAWPLIAAIAAYVAIWVFLSGGLLDRYARARPVATGAFFSACGVFFFRFLRLAVVVGAAYWAIFHWVQSWLAGPVFDWATRDLANEHQGLVLRGWLYAAVFGLLALVNLVADFAKVRAVVEDRRSALAALMAAWRFVRRRPGRCAWLYALNVIGLLVLARLWLQLAASASDPDWRALLIGQVYLVARIWAKLAFMASEIVFFQGELAHAQYTAAPEPIWPDSPAVEAIRNLKGS